ncbi:MAG: flagellar basal body P-ring formation protein FlgA [Fibrobacteria bacterium]|nr:flagellar basal body P-ring formation protein FlgA [Fibrobacteria bacterium]
MSLPALLLAIPLLWASPPPDRTVAKGLRARVEALYRDLQTPVMRLRPDTARVSDSLECRCAAATWSLSRDGGDRPGGSEVLRLVWMSSDGSALRRDILPVRVERRELVPVARRRLGSGQMLDSADLRWEWRRDDRRAQAPPRREELPGRRLARGVGPGQELASSHLQPPYLVRRGDRVRLRLGRGGAHLSGDGLALEDGVAGRRIRVQGPFGSVIRGLVQPDSTLRIE